MNVGERIKRRLLVFKLTRSGAGRTNVQPLMLKRSPKLLRPWGFLSLIFFVKLVKLRSLRGKMLCRLWLGVTPLWCFR